MKVVCLRYLVLMSHHGGPHEPTRPPLPSGGRNWIIGSTTALAVAVILSGHELVTDLPTVAKWVVVFGLALAFLLLGAAIASTDGTNGLGSAVAGVGYSVLAIVLAVAWLVPPVPPAP